MGTQSSDKGLEKLKIPSYCACTEEQHTMCRAGVLFNISTLLIGQFYCQLLWAIKEVFFLLFVECVLCTVL
jgi:hypothetical protein